MKLSKRTLKITFGAILYVFCVSLLFSHFVSALREYPYYKGNNPNGEEQCKQDSGGRQDFESVKYACNAAWRGHHKTGAPQNACASWLGPVGNSSTRRIELRVTKGQPTADIMLYGMCTDDYNTTGDLYVLDDGGSISGIGNFRRGAPWGNVTSKKVTLNIPAFKAIAHSYELNGQKVYWQIVRVLRAHDDLDSYDYELAWIYVYEGEGEIEPEPTDLCKAWEPSSYPNSSENHGTTSIVIKAVNTSGRAFPVTQSGQWHHNGPGGLQGPIYAKPTDTIRWHTCYYPGVQKPYKTQVSDINGVMVNGGANGSGSYEPYESQVYEDVCMGYSPTVGYKELYVGYEDNFGTWENKYQASGRLGSYGPVEFAKGEYQWQSGFEWDANYPVGQTNHSDTGDTLNQKAWTGMPRQAVIGSRSPSHDVVTYDAPCYTDEYKQEYYDTYGVELEDPGNCPQVRCTNAFANDIKPATVDIADANDSVDVIVPYNYQNDTWVTVKDSGETFSGETIELEEVGIHVGTIYNELTDDTYATVVPGAQFKLFMYVSENSDGSGFTSGDASCDVVTDNLGAKQCITIPDKDGNDTVSFDLLNAEGKLEGADETSDSKNSKLRPFTTELNPYNAFDASAGNFICFVSAMTPYSSEDGSWKFGDSDCKVIYKKPTFQVWGSSLYSNKGIEGNEGQKRNFFNDYCNGRPCNEPSGFRLHGGKPVFLTSWVEESLNISNGVTYTVASGAATGYYGTTTKVGNPDGFCTNRSPLSFSNDQGNCNMFRPSVGNSGIGSGIADSATSTNRDDLIEYWTGSTKKYRGDCYNPWGGESCKNIESASGEIIQYIEGENLTVYGGVSMNTTHLVNARNNVNITSDLEYPNGSYTMLAQIPKIIIYANNIYISCNVEKVDAILITRPGGTVDTCVHGGNDASSARARQLKVFGVVITDKINLGRTYGAAAWGYFRWPRNITTDGEAAEVFDYDSTIPMWSEYMSGSAETDTLQITYQHELAPRY